ncbi:MAG: penicillin acylase family protein, partial [Planctomycetia bacterium]|nr:penicillin acylase family protein [Planctomycetia bacterium]
MSISRLLMRLVLGTRLPTTTGELRLRGPVAPITIRRDGRGVPHISAESEADAYFALGFCQGQDRAGQLEVFWRLVRGRLAEWVGPKALVADRASRRIGFRRAAEAQLSVVSPAIRAIFESFAAGISAGITIGLKQKPHEFAIVGGEPSAWDAADVVGFVKLQSFLLPSNWDVELARLRILLADGASAVRDLDPVVVREGVKGRRGGGVTEESQRAALMDDIRADTSALSSAPLHPFSLSPLLDYLAADLSALQAYLPSAGGSNNWVIAGSRTQSGKPILASDPHLAPTCPAPWYLAHIHTPEWQVAGAGLAGTPGFAIGHNGFAAWGVTAGLTDNSDFFLETLGPDGKSVRQPDGTFAPCEVVKEIIRVKGQPDVIEEVLLTPRGPLLTPVISDVNHAVSLSAVWLQARPVIGFLGIPKARSFEEFRRCFSEWPMLPLNVVYADTEGTIGWQLTGELPLRRGGHGLLPRPADLPDSGWTGFVP